MRVDCAPLVNTSDVRSDRNASPKSCGTGSVSTGTRSPRTAGTRPSSGSLRRRVTSSGVFTVSSRYSMPKARPSAIVDAGQDRRDPVLARVRQDRRAGHLGLVHHLDVVRAAVRDDGQLLLLREQRLVDGPFAVGLALQDVVVAALLVEIVRRRLLLLELRREAALLGELRVVLVADVLEDLRPLGDEPAACRGRSAASAASSPAFGPEVPAARRRLLGEQRASRSLFASTTPELEPTIGKLSIASLAGSAPLSWS